MFANHDFELFVINQATYGLKLKNVLVFDRNLQFMNIQGRDEYQENIDLES